jgi:hypothetical protein
MLMNVIPLDATLVQGSHGRHPTEESDLPIVLAEDARLISKPRIDSTAIYELIRQMVLENNK